MTIQCLSAVHSRNVTLCGERFVIIRAALGSNETSRSRSCCLRVVVKCLCKHPRDWPLSKCAFGNVTSRLIKRPFCRKSAARRARSRLPAGKGKKQKKKKILLALARPSIRSIGRRSRNGRTPTETRGIHRETTKSERRDRADKLRSLES